MKRLFATLAATTLTTAPAHAADFILTVGSGSPVIPAPANDFAAQLNALGLFNFTTSGASLSLSGIAKVTFHYLGSESGFTDTFKAGSVTGTENNTNNFGSPVLLGSAIFGPGALPASFKSNGVGADLGIGSPHFGIFLDGPYAPGSMLNSGVVYFGFDDQLAPDPDDDNHDDFIIRATIAAVPEPSTWALMIVGFGIVGFSARRRRTAVTARVAFS